MRGGFRELVNPASLVSTVDLEATREARQALAAEVRLRQHLARLLMSTPAGEGAVEVKSEDTVGERMKVPLGALAPGVAREVARADEEVSSSGPEAA